MSKPTWVFVVGMYRSGSTTQYRMAEEIVQSTENGVGIGYHTEARLEQHDLREDLPGKGYIVCKVFIYLPETSPHGARFLQEERTKVAGTTRDPRDIYVSMRARESDRGAPVGIDYFETTVRENFPRWFAQFDQWADLPGAHVVRFEEMTKDLVGEVRGIARLLDIPLSEEQAQEIASHYTIEAHRQSREEYLQSEDRENRREHSVLPSIPDIRFGTSGHWRNHLTAVEARVIQEMTARYMARWGYQ
jgi:hypothetical protein